MVTKTKEKESPKFTLYWGKAKNGRLCYFVRNKLWKGAVPVEPVDLLRFLQDKIKKSTN